MNTAPTPGNSAADYCACMEDIKQRVTDVQRIVSGFSPMGEEFRDAEVVFLLIRKTLEQIAFASLIANRNAYAQVHKNFAEAWRIKHLLEHLEKIHPNYYPRPVYISPNETGQIKRFCDITDGYLTKDDLVFLYDKCSEVLHTRNPYKPGSRVVNTQRPIAEWMQRIQLLLNLHYVDLSGQSDVWLIQMTHPTDGKVHAALATRQENGPAA